MRWIALLAMAFAACGGEAGDDGGEGGGGAENCELYSDGRSPGDGPETYCPEPGETEFCWSAPPSAAPSPPGHEGLSCWDVYRERAIAIICRDLTAGGRESATCHYSGPCPSGVLNPICCDDGTCD